MFNPGDKVMIGTQSGTFEIVKEQRVIPGAERQYTISYPDGKLTWAKESELFKA